MRYRLFKGPGDLLWSSEMRAPQ